MPFKTEVGQQFPAEAYAYVGDPANPASWALRVWESVHQKVTAAQVSRCVAALSATRAGRGHGLPSDAIPGVKAKLLTLWSSVHHELPVPMVLKTFAAVGGDTKTFTMQTGMPPLVKADDGSYAVLGMKIFKTGTFRDSSGAQHTIDSDYLEAAVNNFYALKDTGVLPNVPWRLNHSRDVKDVCGYFENAYLDPTREFLMCDFAFTNAVAAQDYADKKYRSRSIEIGAHTTNAEETYDPVIMGCAFVDLPAVEGLYSYTSDGSQFFPFQEIETMPTFTLNGMPVTDEKAIQEYIVKLEKDSKTPVIHEFTVGTAKVTDFAAVQTQLDRIPQFEAFMADMQVTAREAAVDEAVKANKFGAPQADALKGFVKTLSEEQFTAWKATTDSMPAIPAFGAYVGGGNGDTRNPAEVNGVPNVIEDAKEQVAMHIRAGMKRETLEKTQSFMTLKAAGVVVAY